MEYREKIDKIVEEIIKINEDVIIVGDNSSGKSDILKSVITLILLIEFLNIKILLILGIIYLK